MAERKNPSVTLFTREYPPFVYGGAGVHVQFLAAALAELTEVRVRCFGDSPPAGTVPARSFHPPPGPLAEAEPKAAKILEPLLTNVLMLAPPPVTDVIHCHTWYTMFAGFLARTLYGKPLVATVHSLEPLRPWKEEQLGRGYRLSTWCEESGLRAADLVIAVSAGMRADILRAYDLDEAKVRVIHNGIDPERFRRTEESEAVERRGIQKPYILFVGRVSRQKGLDVLLAAAADLPEDLTVAICTGAPDTPGLADELKAAAAGLPRVHWFEEMIPHADLVQLYSHAAAFVCPSVYEPFGLINLEAMACERPVVASRVGGIPEVVADGETGFLVPPGDPQALAAAIRRLLADPPLAARMGAAGRKRVEELFTWRAVARTTLAAYAEVLDTARP